MSQLNELNEAIKNLGMLTQFFHKQCESLTNALKKEHDDYMTKQKNELLHIIRSDTKEIWENHSYQYLEHIDKMNDKMYRQIQEFDKYSKSINEKNKRLVFFSWISVAISLFILLIGSIWLSNHYLRIIQRNHINAELLTLINTSDIIKCGDNLCANINKNKVGKYNVIQKK